ncbi:MAG TPA: cupin domain-containing protein [Polyangia bacterium]|nr:cupin domain-containing protein [Polyangia bacterium]
MTRTFLAVATLAVIAVAPPPARGNARAETEEARVADILQSALVKHGGDVNRCFEKALADTLDVAGKIELAVDVGDGGRVVKAAPASDSVKSPVLLACLTEAAATWTLVGLDPGSTVILPLAFEGQTAQFSIKVKDAPDHGPPAPPSKKQSPTPPVPPFSVKLLVDEATMHAQKAALTQLTIAPAYRIAMHKHPGAEALYVLKGHARILGPTGVAPEKLDEGMAVLIPGGMPHAIENMGRTSSAVMLDVFAPMGPERVYRDPKDEAGRAAFEVIHGAPPAAPAGAKFTVAAAADADKLSVFGGKGKLKPLLEPATTGNKALYLGILEAEPGAEVPRNTHPGSAEILYVVSGAGDVTIGSEKIPFEAEEAIHIPDGQPHAAKFAGPERTIMVQVFAPGGPEERYRAAQAGGKPAKPK